jgi:hypothetical protein
MFGGALLFQGPLNGSDASQVLLEVCFGMPVSIVEGLGGILKARETGRADEAHLRRQR